MKAGLMLGVNPNTEREDNDYYATDPYAIQIALPTLQKIGLNKKVWEVACGEGHLAKELEKNGYTVKATDLVDRGYGEVSNFLTNNDHWNGDILTNPPFNKAEEFIRHSFDVINNGNRIFMFLKIQFLETPKRKQLFEEFPLEYLIVNSQRIGCARNGNFGEYMSFRNGKWCGDTQFYAWFVFRKSYDGDSKILWI